jgi:hypothetical protein
MNKILHDLQFIFTAGFKSAGLVENITVILCEYEFVLDVMQATLQAASSRSVATGENQPVQPPLKGRVESGEVMR